MSLQIINYDRSNQTHLSLAIALRDCVQYLVENGQDTEQALTMLGVTPNKRYHSAITNTTTISVLDLPDELQEKLLSKKQEIKRIRRGI